MLLIESICKFTGLLPIAQPPGRATSALENFVKRGPRTSIEALIVLTNSYLAFKLFIGAASTNTSISSLSIISNPIEPSSSIIVVTSIKWGKLLTFIGESDNRQAAKTGNAEFFAPEAYISPSNLFFPCIRSLSIVDIHF